LTHRFFQVFQEFLLLRQVIEDGIPELLIRPILPQAISHRLHGLLAGGFTLSL